MKKICFVLILALILVACASKPSTNNEASETDSVERVQLKSLEVKVLPDSLVKN